MPGANCIPVVCEPVLLSQTVLSELFQKSLVSEKDLERIAGQSGSLSARLGVPVQLNKHEREAIVNETATVLDNFAEYKEAASKLRGW